MSDQSSFNKFECQKSLIIFASSVVRLAISSIPMVTALTSLIRSVSTRPLGSPRRLSSGLRKEVMHYIVNETLHQCCQGR